MFGGFNLSAGFNQLQEFGEKFQKIKEDIEHNIESSLRPDSSTAANQAGADTRTEEAALDGWGDFDGFINTDSNVEARKGASDTSTSQQTSGESAAHVSSNGSPAEQQALQPVADASPGLPIASTAGQPAADDQQLLRSKSGSAGSKGNLDAQRQQAASEFASGASIEKLDANYAHIPSAERISNAKLSAAEEPASRSGSPAVDTSAISDAATTSEDATTTSAWWPEHAGAEPVATAAGHSSESLGTAQRAVVSNGSTGLDEHLLKDVHGAGGLDADLHSGMLQCDAKPGTLDNRQAGQQATGVDQHGAGRAEAASDDHLQGTASGSAGSSSLAAEQNEQPSHEFTSNQPEQHGGSTRADEPLTAVHTDGLQQPEHTQHVEANGNLERTASATSAAADEPTSSAAATHAAPPTGDHLIAAQPASEVAEDGASATGSYADPQPATDGAQPALRSTDAAEPAGEAPAIERPRVAVDMNAGSMDEAALRGYVWELQAALKAREVQLERKFEEVAAMQEVTQQLMARNEELARKAQKISEEDLDSMQAEFEARLGTAERKVYALTKERDALRRGTEKLSTVNELLKEKDGIIAQVMEEGEKLSKKQLAQESTIRKLRMQLKELEGAKLDAEGRAAAEATKIEAANRAKAKAEGDIAALREQHRTELDAQKQHYEGLLQRSRTAQLESEERAASSAKEGLARKVKEAEARAESLAETVEELRLALERQRAAADLREDLLQREIADMERRCQAAEARHEELAGKLPEATRPLLRQIEAMQSAAAAQQEAWAGAERSLSERVDAAEARAATAIERERSAGERLQAANARLASMAAALEAVRSEAAETAAALEAEQQQRYAAEARARKADEQLKQANDRVWALQREREDVENTAKAAVAAERQASLAAMVAAEERLQAAESRLQAVQNPQPSTPDRQRAGAPPALAGPGYKWVLMREGEEPRSRQQPASSSGSTPRAAAGSGSGSVGFSKGMAAELERLRDAVRIKEDQLASVQQQISSLEATRDSLAEELVAVSQTAEAGAEASRELERLRAEHEQVHRRLQASIEMLGERDERIEELRADVADVKQLYKDQIEFMVEQLAKQNVSVPS